MNLENIKEENGIYYLNTKSFATIKLKYIFLLDNDEKTILSSRVLAKYLKETNKKYKTFKEIRDKQKELYNIKIIINQDYIGKQNIFNISFELISSRIIEDDYIKIAISFAHEMILNPNFENNKLNKEILTKIKKDIINDTKRNLSNPKLLNKRLLLHEIAKDSNITKNITLNAEKEEQELEKLTEQDIINLYNKIINESFYKGFIFGNINKKEYEIIKKAFPFKNNKKTIDYTELLKIPHNYKEEENENIKTSSLYVVYKLNNYTTDKLYLYKTLAIMLNNTNGLCNKILREELGIVYCAGPYINKYRFFGFIIIEANISKENKEKCLQGIDEIWKRLKDKKIVKELLKYAIEKQNQNDITSEDNIQEILNDLENYVLKTRPDKKTLHNQVNNIKPEDIIKEVDNIEKHFIYFYKGVK